MAINSQTAKQHESGASMETGVLQKVLEFLWVPIIAMVAWIMKRLSVHDTTVVLLTEQCKNAERQRIEDKEQHKLERREIIDKIDDHHKVVMGRFDSFDRE